MSNARNVLSSLSHRLGATGSARVRVFDGSGAPSPRRVPFVLSALAVCLGVLALTAAPALAAAPEPEEPKTIEPATSITGTSAVFEGVLNPHSEALVGGYFVYSEPNGITCVEGPTAGLEGFEGEQDVKAQAVHVTVGLQPGRKYKFCLVAYNEGGAQIKLGNEVTVETPALAPSIDSESVSATNSTSSTLEAQVNPNNQETTFSFEYASKGTVGAGGKLEGTITTLPGKTPLPGVYGDQTATVPKLEGLTPGAGYYYRVVAKNATGTATGSVTLFTTVPTPTTDPASPVAAAGATLNGHFALNETTSTQYRFTYSKGPACSGENPITTASVEASTGKGTPVAAKAVISELTPDSEYTACLTTSNQYGYETGAPVHFTTLIRESVIEVTATSAELQAEINPNSATTTYHFEYGPTTSYGHSTPERTLFGEDTNLHTGSAAIQELAPATEYHYRVIAHNASGTTTGPDQTFTTHATGGEFRLPDDRAWEMVSPTNKHGAGLLPQTVEGGIAQAAEDGSAMTYAANAPIAAHPEGNIAIQFAQVLSTRGSSGGWASREVTTPYAESLLGPGTGQRAEYMAFSPTLSSAMIERIHNHGEEEIPLSPLASEPTIYLREALGTPGPGDYVPLVNDDNVAAGTHYGGDSLAFRGASTNLEHVVFSAGKLTSAGGNGLYEWTAGTLNYIGEGYLGDGNQNVRGAVAEDGQRVFFDSERSEGAGHIYARLVSSEQTLQLDVVQGGSGSGEPGNLRFQYATPDGMKVYFTDDQRLTANSTAEPKSPELYEYDFAKPAGHELTDLTPNPGGTSTDVQGETEISENGEYVYFYANGTLDGGREGNCGADFPPAGTTCNLYVTRIAEGAASTSLIATLSFADHPDWTGDGRTNSQATLKNIASGASPSGRYFAFMSSRPLTGYDNRDAVSGERDEEVFLYDAVADRLTCVSCNPTGVRPRGTFDTGLTEGGIGTLGLLVDRAQTWRIVGADSWLAGFLPGWTSRTGESALYRPRYLTNEGRMFFDSADSLVPQDTNGSFDVYEYEPEGPDCGSGATSGSEVFEPARRDEGEGRGEVSGGSAAGCVALISSGESNEESALLDASGKGPGGQEGEDVFFLTSARLSPQDVDTAFDVYDAHVCSAAAPCPAGVAVSPPCSTADSCRAAPAAQPSSFGATPSATYSGPGDLAPAAQGVPVSKPVTGSERLAAALKRCRRDRTKHKRASCEAQTRRRYAGTKRADRQHRSMNTNRRTGR